MSTWPPKTTPTYSSWLVEMVDPISENNYVISCGAMSHRDTFPSLLSRYASEFFVVVFFLQLSLQTLSSRDAPSDSTMVTLLSR